MRLIGNLIWFFFGGFLGWCIWMAAGILWCITVIGIPVGLQCFKFAKVALWPFGKEIVYDGNGVSLIANIIWVLFPGFEMALGYVVIGLFFCITIIGIPFGKQFFKLARLAFSPFGSRVV